jgi:hypothetical protein
MIQIMVYQTFQNIYQLRLNIDDVKVYQSLNKSTYV